MSYPPTLYSPQHFVESDTGKLHDAIESFSFATIVSAANGNPFVTHMPLLLDRTRGDLGTLVGHFAKANPHSGLLESGPMLAIFHGPHTYVSPAWYQEPNTVPTWNYVKVHATGKAKTIDDRDQLLKIITAYVAAFEETRPTPWRIETADGPFVDKLLHGIVGFEIEISRLEGKFKLSQNHSSERRARVATELKAQGDENAISIAHHMGGY